MLVLNCLCESHFGWSCYEHTYSIPPNITKWNELNSLKKNLLKQRALKAHFKEENNKYNNNKKNTLKNSTLQYNVHHHTLLHACKSGSHPPC